MKNINKKLDNKRLQLSQLKKNRTTLSNLKKRLDHKVKLKQKAEEILQKEAKEFKRIDGLSLASLFYSILGTKQEKLNKEKQEYLLAKLNFDTLTDEIEMIKSKLSKLELENSQQANIEEEYLNLLKAKEVYLITQKGIKGKQLELLSDELYEINKELKEIEEALASIEKVVKGLYAINEKLESAKNWGTLDILGGGMLVTAIKHNKINGAKTLIAQTQFEVDNFIEELRDISSMEKFDASIEISDFTTLSDYIFDGLIFDFTIQLKIHQSIREVKSFLTKTLEIKDDLSSLHKEKKSDTLTLNQKRLQLLI